MKRRELLAYTGVLTGATVASSIGASRTEADAATVNPVIPQRDSAGGRIKRAVTLAGKRADYRWTTSFPTLPGIPLAQGIPLDDLPTLDWLVYAVSDVVDLFENFLTSVIAQFSADLDAKVSKQRTTLASLHKKIDKIKTEYETVKKATGTGPVSPGTALKLADLRRQISGPGGVMNQLGDVHQSLTKTVSSGLKGQSGIGDFGSKDGLKKYDAIWASKPIPTPERNLHDDEYFAALRLEGANPMIMRRVEGKLPGNFPLTKAQFEAGSRGDDLAAALREKRLFICDYEELGSMAPSHATYKLLTGEGWNSAPIALFVAPKGGEPLQPVAIQVGQDPKQAAMFVRPDEKDASEFWGWQMAKTVVQTADFNHHEMFVHLARTHLVSEAFCVATNRHLAPTHPLNVLLRPHFEGDLWINFFAALLIMSPDTFADIILAAPVKDSADGARRSRMSWDFYENMPPAELAARGVTDKSVLPEYPYRDDAMSVWESIHSWADDYVHVYYRTDSDVTGDTELKAWADELRTTGKVKGFRAITSVDQLVDVVAMVMFTASAQHAAVNYPQRDLMSYAPFASGVDATAPPTSEKGHDEADWIAMLPSVFGALAQMYFLNFLAGFYYRPLGDYRQNTFPYRDALTDPRVAGSGGPLARFKSSLTQVENTINGRNAQRKRPYPYLLPSQIPTSTNI